MEAGSRRVKTARDRPENPPKPDARRTEPGGRREKAARDRRAQAAGDWPSENIRTTFTHSCQQQSHREKELQKS